MRSCKFDEDHENAAKFIYLNRTGFNGIYRVNLSGTYNVPYGHKSYKQLFDFDNLRLVSKVLKKAEIRTSDFEEGSELIRAGDFVFLDPPYTVTHIKNGFIKYNEKLFSWNDQIRLSKFIESIKLRGAYYLLTNAKHKAVADLFGVLDEPITVNRSSVVGGKNARRGLIQEYLFTNSKDIRKEAT